MTNKVYISICDGYFGATLQEDLKEIELISYNTPLTVTYNRNFKLFENVTINTFFINDIDNYSEYINNLPDYAYKLNYQELWYLTINEIIKITLQNYQKYYPLNKLNEIYFTLDYKDKLEDCVINAIDYVHHRYSNYIFYTINLNQTLPGLIQTDSLFNYLNYNINHVIIEIGTKSTKFHIYHLNIKDFNYKTINRNIVTEANLINTYELETGYIDLIFEIINKTSNKYTWNKLPNGFKYNLKENLDSLSNYEYLNNVNFRNNDDDLINISIENIFNTEFYTVFESVAASLLDYNSSFQFTGLLNIPWLITKRLNYYSTKNINLIITNGTYHINTISLTRLLKLNNSHIYYERIFENINDIERNYSYILNKKNKPHLRLISINSDRLFMIKYKLEELINHFTVYQINYTRILNIKANIQRDKKILYNMYKNNVNQINDFIKRIEERSCGDPFLLETNWNYFKENITNFI